MKVKYLKSKIQNNIIYGLLMIGVGIFAVYINSSSIFSYLWIFIGMLQTGTALYQRKNQYLTIEQDRLIKHSIIPKSVELSEIRSVRSFVNSYRIETVNRSLLIEKNCIEEGSLKELESFLKTLRPGLAT